MEEDVSDQDTQKETGLFPAVMSESTAWALPELSPAPDEEWDRLRRFQAINAVEREAMLRSVPALFRRGYELVVANYDYLSANPETAQILGWENGADADHLEERRRFFTIWLARLLGMDFSHELAYYLFRAGQYHAGFGPRKVQVPPVYVTGAASLVNAAFARVLVEEMPTDPSIPEALAGWNKVLTLHLHMMLLGYDSARSLSEGSLQVPVSFYGRLRAVTNQTEIMVGVEPGAPVTNLLRKIFNFFPKARGEALDIIWIPGEHLDAVGNPWMTVNKTYQPKRGWRVLLNGRDISYLNESERNLHAGDSLQIFPPGR